MAYETSSGITGAEWPGPGASKSIGPARGEIASETVQAVVPFRRPGPTVAEADRGLAVSLKRQHGLRLAINSRMEFPADGGFRVVVEGVGLAIDPGGSVASGLAAVNAAMVPADVKTIALALARLRVLVVPRSGSNQDLDFEAEVWLDQLRRYPADVVVETLDEWPRRRGGRFWPTWHELREVLEAKAAPRRAMVDRLRVAWEAGR